MLDVCMDVDGWRAAEDVFRLCEDVLDEGLGDDAQRDFAIDAAEGEIVDLVAEGRDVGSLAGVEIDGQQVVSVEVDVRSELEGEWRVAAFVFAELSSVDPDGRGGHGAFKVDEDTFAFGLGGELEASAVDGDKFVGL